MPPEQKDPRERLWARVEKTDTCWLWMGYRDRKGYGTMSMPQGGKHTPRYVHRLAYEFEVGLIPDGLTLDHLCRVPNCVNPAHLEPVTAGENVLRGMGPSARAARRGTCSYGHLYDDANTGFNGDGSRYCRICNRAKYHRRKALVA